MALGAPWGEQRQISTEQGEIWESGTEGGSEGKVKGRGSIIPESKTVFEKGALETKETEVKKDEGEKMIKRRVHEGVRRAWRPPNTELDESSALMGGQYMEQHIV